MNKNIVAIVGRPNVGKSTLFNRLTESRDAIVHETAGVTRDRHYGHATWNGIDFSVIDTGGYVVNSDDVFEEEIRKQVLLAIDEADAILFLTDVTTGITDLDSMVADLLRRTEKPVLVAVNKVDSNDRINDMYSFYEFGLGELFPLSSASGFGTGELLDALVGHFAPFVAEEEEELPKITIVGRPNVGKSSLINALIGEERNIVTPISGTTRDSILTRYQKFNHDFFLVDTAGLRKKGKVQEDLEFYSVLRSIRAIESSDVCILMLDGTQGIESQDLSIFNLIKLNKKGMVVVVNKWDLVEKDHHTMKKYEEVIRARIAPFVDVPIIFTSVLEKQRLLKVLESALDVYENRRRRIPTSRLNEVVKEMVERNHPPIYKGKEVKIKYVTQLPTPTPVFAFFCNLPQYIRDPYKRYLENQLRQHFDFKGVPIQIVFRAK